MSKLTEEFRALVAKEKDFNMKCEAEFDVQYPTMFLNLDFINGNNYIIHPNHHTFLSLLLPPAATYIKGYSPRYAFLMESLFRRSLALPSRTILPVSNTYALSAIDSAFFVFCSTNRTVVPLLLTS